MSTFEMHPKQPRISGKYLEVIKVWGERNKNERIYPDPVDERARILAEELVMAPGAYGIITGCTRCFKPLRSMENLERLVDYIKEHTPETRGFSLTVRPQLPPIDTTISFKNVVCSFEVECVPYFELDSLGISYIPRWGFKSLFDPIPNDIHYKFIQPRSHYLKDLKLGVNSEYVVLRDIKYYRMYNGHPIYYDYGGNDMLFDLTLDNANGVHIRELLKNTMLSADFLNAAIMKGFVKDSRFKPYETPQQNKSSNRRKEPWMRSRKH